MSSTTNRYLSYPAAAAGISRASSGGAAWSYSAYTQIVPASTITSDFYLTGVTWCWHTPMAAADTTYQWIIEIASDTAGSPVLLVQIPASARGDTLAGYVPSMFITLPEPKYVAANTQIGVRVAYSLATTSNTLTGIKIFYQIP
jgi:hypothetical protein